MKIILAENAGFCWGVHRAVKLAEEAAEQHGSISIIGDLIHNRAVTERLASLGARTVESPDKIEGGPVVIRAHGVTPETKSTMEEKGLDIVDGTCPFVATAQKAAQEMEKEGRQVIIIGKKGHPEVEAVLGHTKSGMALRSEGEIDALPALLKVGVIAQTTEDTTLFQRLCDKIVQKFGDVVIRNTICSATDQRQGSARDLASRVNVMIVVGDRHSSNTTNLADICRQITQTHHITCAEELEREWILGGEAVGVTAGASTPDWVIDAVIERIRRMALDSGEHQVTVIR